MISRNALLHMSQRLNSARETKKRVRRTEASERAGGDPIATSR
jgi:hypothetical protein